MTTDPSLFSEFTIRGLFWREGNNTRQFPGLVTMRRGEISLLVDGLLLGDEENAPCRVLGCSREEVELTLEGAVARNDTSVNGRVEQELLCLRLWLGGHISAATVFTKATFKFTNFDDWLGWQPFKSAVAEGPGGTVGPMTVTLDILPAQNFQLQDNTEVHISGTRSGGHKSTSRTLSYTAQLRFQSAQPAPFQHYDSLQQAFKTLLSVFLGKAVYLDEERYATSEVTEMQSYHQQNITSTPEALNNFRIAFPWSLVKDGLDSYFKTWLGIHEKARSSLDLYLGTIYNDHSYLESDFLALTQALESLHRRFHPGTYVPDADYSEIKQAIGTALGSTPMPMPVDLREALKARIRFGNEFSLRRRLKETIESLDARLLGLVTKRPPAEFIAKTVDTRNHLTHDPTDLPNRPAGQALYDLLRQVSLLTRIVILHHIGVSPEIMLRGLRLQKTSALDA